VTLSYTNANVPAVQVTVKAGQVVAYDNTLKTLWNLDGNRRAVIAATDTPRRSSSRPGRTAAATTAARTGSSSPASRRTTRRQRRPPLQVVQLEQVARLPLEPRPAEVTGKSRTIDIAGFTPIRRSPRTPQRTLARNEFVQLGTSFAAGFSGNTYNGRIAVSVIGGTGRVAAYGSVVDNRTQRPDVRACQ